MIPKWQSYFPSQRVGAAEKAKSTWYANCIDYIIDAGLSLNDKKDVETKINILHGNIPDEFYKKTLNPYNSSNEKYKRFPATMRNFDIIKDIIRRYISEYHKSVHEFIVGANNPEIALKKNIKLKNEIMKMALQAFQQELEKKVQEIQQQQSEDAQNQDAQQSQVQQPMSGEELLQAAQQQLPSPDEFAANFEKNYVDDQSKQGQDVLDYVRAMTDDTLIYLSAFFNFCSFGECYTYTDIRGGNIVKESIPLTEAYPIPNSNFFVEDHDMFARKMMMSYQQIMDSFGDYLSNKDKEFLEKFYANGASQHSGTKLMYSHYFEYYPDVCAKFSDAERKLFKSEPISIHDDNNNLYEVWHVVWRGEARQGILTYINEIGFPAKRIVEEGYTLNKEAGDIEIEWVYKPQVYEGYRIGTRYDSIYPIKARPVAYNREGKLPYNGIMEVLPLFGKFSIVGLVTPFQIMRNIFIYHREMVIAKNKMLILLLPESLVASDTEDKIYKMAADGTLLIDDTEDSNMVKAQQIRLLNANMGDYITQLTNLIESIKLEAREIVDMNAQRYGQITQYAGANTTQQAVAQASMGSVVINQMFDEFRKRDYNRDLDYAKFAFVDGLDTAFYDETNTQRFLSLDVNSFISADYSTTVRNDSKEVDKLQQLRQWAFSAAQNGDLEMALAAIKGDNVSQISAAIDTFTQIKQQHEQEMKQVEQMLEQQKLQNELAKIQAKGEEDRKTEQLKYYYEMQLKNMDVDMSMLAPDDSAEQKAAANRLATIVESNKLSIEQGKLDIARQKLAVDSYNAAADRAVKIHDIDTKLKIAKENKNQYDKK